MSDGESLAAKGRELEFSQATPTPPPDAQAMTRDPLTTMDAKLWAEEFMRIFGSKMDKIDEGLMIAWFANAIMKGYDVGCERQAETIRKLEEQRDYAQAECRRIEVLNASLQARLTASEAKYKWTTARPTVPGWYWWRANRTAAAQIIKVLDDFTAESMTGCSDHVDEIGGEFQGPLTPGEE